MSKALGDLEDARGECQKEIHKRVELDNQLVAEKRELESKFLEQSAKADSYARDLRRKEEQE